MKINSEINSIIFKIMYEINLKKEMNKYHTKGQK